MRIAHMLLFFFGLFVVICVAVRKFDFTRFAAAMVVLHHVPLLTSWRCSDCIGIAFAHIDTRICL